MGENDSSEKIDEIPFFCGHQINFMDSITEGGRYTINGISTTKYTVTFKPAPDDSATSLYDMKWEVFVSRDGKLVREIQSHPYSNTKRRVTYSGWGEPNINNPAAGSRVHRPRPAAFRPDSGWRHAWTYGDSHAAGNGNPDAHGNVHSAGNGYADAPGNRDA